MTLTGEEFNLLTRIASWSKMDCWFMIKQRRSGEDYVFNLEEHKKMSLRTGIRLLMEGVSGDYDRYLEQEDYKVMVGLLERFL